MAETPSRIPPPDLLVRYWSAVAPRALPHLAGRLLRLVMDVDGEPVFHRGEPPATPPSVRRIVIEKREGGRRTRLAIEDAAGLRALAELGVVELHPWTSRIEAIEVPDRVMFDLDLDPALPWDLLVEVAVRLRDQLAAWGLTSWPKTSGGNGLHLVVPILPERGHDDVRRFAQAVADGLVLGLPDLPLTTSALRGDRRGRLCIDPLRNGRGNTLVGTFVPRARPGFPASLPLSWKEVMAGVRGDAFPLDVAVERVARTDPWTGFDRRPPSLHAVLTTFEQRAS